MVPDMAGRKAAYGNGTLSSRDAEGGNPAFRAGNSSLPDNSRPLPLVLLRNYGLSGSLRLIASDVVCDVLQRIDTARPTSIKRAFPLQGFLAGALADCNRYVPSTWSLVEAVSKRLARELDPTRTGFVDLGSGKGKALIVAARAGWCSVRGVELSEHLHLIATDNLRKLGFGTHVRSGFGDAAELEPGLEECAIYLFNPFTGKTLEHCLDRIVLAGERATRWIAYVNPTEHAEFTRRFDLVEHAHVEPGHIEIAYFRTRTSACL